MSEEQTMSTQGDFDPNSIPTALHEPVALDPKPATLTTQTQVGPEDRARTSEATLPPGSVPTKGPQAQQPEPIQANDAGQLIPRNSSELMRFSKMICDSGLVPDALRTPQKVAVAYQFAIELGLSPVAAMRQMMVVNGSPSIWGDLPLAIVRRSRKLDEFSEVVLDKDMQEICLRNNNLLAEPYMAVCKAKRADDGYEVERFFSVQDATKAGLISSSGQAVGKKDIWPKYLRRMLQMRARSWCLKDCFPDILSGVAIAEYDLNTYPDAGVETPAEAASRLSGNGDALTAEFTRKEEANG